MGIVGHTFVPVSGAPLRVDAADTGACPHDDVQARRLLQCAQGALQKWPEGFRGFSAMVRCREGQEIVTGDVRVFTGGRVEVELPETPISTWAKAALGALSLARTPRFFKDGDGQFPISFDLGDDRELGRSVRVHLGGPGYRVYRIDAKGHIRQEEHGEPTRRATAIYDGLVRTCPGRVVPTRIHILAWDVMTQTPLETADIEDAYECRAYVWLPVSRRAIAAYGDLRRELTLEMSRHVRLWE